MRGGGSGRGNARGGHGANRRIAILPDNPEIANAIQSNLHRLQSRHGNVGPNVIPFSRLSSSSFQSVVVGRPRSSNNISQNLRPSQIIETFLDANEPGAAGLNSVYTHTFQYNAPASASPSHAVELIHRRMLRRVRQAGGISRVRMVWNERVRHVRTRLVQRHARQGVPQSVYRGTRRFHTPDSFEESAEESILEEYYSLFESNESVEIGGVDFILDVENNHGSHFAGGRAAHSLELKRPREHGPNWEVDKVSSAKYLNMQGKIIMLVPTQTDYLCGWICLALHLAKHFVDRRNLSKSRQNFEQMWPNFPAKDFIRLCLDRGTPSGAPQTPVKALYDNIDAMIVAAKLLINYCESLPMFSLQQTPQQIVDHFPELKIVVTTGSGTFSDERIAVGDRWVNAMNNENVAIQENKWTVYMSYDSDRSHMHYIPNMLKFVASEKTLATTNYWWCHRCLNLLSLRDTGNTRHRCNAIRCDMCCTHFADAKELRAHKKPAETAEQAFNSLPEMAKENIDMYTADLTADTKCLSCMRTFYSRNCFNAHLSAPHNQGCSINNRREKCDACGCVTLSITKHNCDPERLVKCPGCKEEVSIADLNKTHRCFVQRQENPITDFDMWPEAMRDDHILEESRRFFAFDFESMLIPMEPKLMHAADGTAVLIPRNKHVVNFVSVMQCGTDKKWRFDNIADFVRFAIGEEKYYAELLSKDKELQAPRVVFVAHNLKGYDGRLLFDELIKMYRDTEDNMLIPHTVMWNGTKLMGLNIGKYLSFRDSLLHIARPLAEFPSIFGLDQNKFKKGFFPYLFNKPENMDYCENKIPDIKYFEPDMMSGENRKKFLKWHATQRAHRVLYNFKNELVEYCESDVSILKESLQVYIRENILMNQGLNPMDAMTIASYAYKVYTTLHMPESTIAVLDMEETLFAKRAFHGGRTDVRQMVKFYTDDQIKKKKTFARYQDVQSLYPYVQFFKDLPCGIPAVIKYIDKQTGEELRPQPTLEAVRDDWFGFVECDLEITEYMHHPPIVTKQDGKLMATLENKNRIVLPTVELKAAINTGCYKLGKVYEYHEYQRAEHLFKEYISKFMKIKVQTSGMPSYVKNDEQWEAYAAEYKNQLGITLERDKMVKNAGRKQIAKLMLNSLWGKFAESKNYSQQKIIKTREEYRQMEEISDMCGIDISLNMHLGHQKYLCIFKKINDGMLDTSDDMPVGTAIDYNRMRAYRTNIALAAFVTAHGALMLWEEMNKLGMRVLYHDTDSIIYEYQGEGNAYNIPLGKFLGEWEDETGGKPIHKFVSIGPKSYAYAYKENPETVSSSDIEELTRNEVEFDVLDDTDEHNDRIVIQRTVYCCKCKGFTLNWFNSHKINFATMHQLVIGRIQALESKNLNFTWNRVAGCMNSFYEKKIMKFNYDKGIIDRNTWMVYPHGADRFIDGLVY